MRGVLIANDLRRVLFIDFKSNILNLIQTHAELPKIDYIRCSYIS